MASHADARAQGGLWLVRLEDLDAAREVPGAAAEMLVTLRAFGMTSDAPVMRQQPRRALYAAALERLAAAGHSYPCGCTRTEIARAALPGLEGPRYPGTCRAGLAPGRRPRAIRLALPEHCRIAFSDRIQGDQEQWLNEAVGDFVLRRADGLHAYQLAVVFDDAWQGITHVVRGADLLASTPRQILLQRLLGLPSPSYAHVPLAVDAEGRKLSKSAASAPVDPRDPLAALHRAWRFLGQSPLPEPADVAGFWALARQHWDMGRVPAQAQLQP